MLDALKTTTTGLLQSERRATDIAKEILTASAAAASFTLESDVPNTPTSTITETESSQAFGLNTASAGYGDILQHLVDLRAEQQAFKANAEAFKRIDETLGTLLDDNG
ncbi:hypothetical protein [Kordiimonas pumila]|uniref:Flagellar basal-body/hook protein C-terminal domain-containing protein n=1 Tax=Kordiimonas pumila TaxID=2161677 RepID=A0ABV7D3T2_9PROT|nr:hypothetical protein [Kordiimonas pumila]